MKKCVFFRLNFNTKFIFLKKLYIFIFFLYYSSLVYAQLETSNWYFGQNLGLKFQGNEISPLTDGQLFTGEGCAVISDKNGELLFYTDGSTVYNRIHQVMLNGTDLKGSSSSTQSAIIVPFPEDENKYIIFTVGADDYATVISTLNEGLNFYYVDLLLDNGLGGVVFPENNNLLPLSSEKIAAVQHINRKDYWIVTHFENKFYSYLVNSNGINRNPVVSTIGPYIDPRTYPVNARGYLKISPNGKKIAIAHLSNLNYDRIPLNNLPTLTDQFYPSNGPFANAWPGYLGVYNFNKGNGLVTDELILDELGSPYGIEFSANSKVLYGNSDYHTIDSLNNVTWRRGELYQYDLNLNPREIIDSKQIIRSYFIQDTSSAIFTARGALQLALNNKIYLSRDNQYHLSHIKNPDSIDDPQFEEIGYRFTYATWNIKTRYGLPPFISSSFVNEIEIIGTDLYTVCLGNSIQLRFTNPDEVSVLSYLWKFGDGQTSTEASPIHQFNQSGVFTVQLQINTSDYGVLNFEIELTVLDEILLNEATLEACDYDSDGKVTFDLTLANQQISDSDNLQYTYFKTREDAVRNINELDSNYLSTATNEDIFVRATNDSGCFNTTKISLNHLLPERFNLNPIAVCVTDEQETVFLQDYNILIEELLNDRSILSINYFTNENDLLTNLNNVSSVTISNTQKSIYARVELLNEECSVFVEFVLKPSLIPPIKIEDVLKCKDNKAQITAPVGYTYQWIGLKDEDLNQDLSRNSIFIKNEGDYTLILINDNGCQRRIDFSVSNYDEIEVLDVYVDQSNSIHIQALGNDYSYSFDGVNWQSENVIVGLSSGVYKIFVRNASGCVFVVGEAVIFKWTNFLSPNQDLHNDKWEINGLEKYKNVEIKIFDRYGKLLVNKVLNNEKVIWDGTYNGKKQPSDSYWYTIVIPGYIKYSGFLLLKNKI